VPSEIVVAPLPEVQNVYGALVSGLGEFIQKTPQAITDEVMVLANQQAAASVRHEAAARKLYSEVNQLVAQADTYRQVAERAGNARKAELFDRYARTLEGVAAERAVRGNAEWLRYIASETAEIADKGLLKSLARFGGGAIAVGYDAAQVVTAIGEGNGAQVIAAIGGIIGALAVVALAAVILPPATLTGITAALVAGGAAFVGNVLGDLLFSALYRALPDSIRARWEDGIRALALRDPLTLDLDADGLETLPVSAGVLFDHDGDGVRTGTGWVASDDGFLVLDRNGNGTIDSGRELFGDSTLKTNGQLAIDGFDALADLDTNADGKVDSLDAFWDNLRVWRDLDQDGVSDAGELATLSSLGITGFNTAKTANAVVLADGNRIADLGSYEKSDGTTGTMGDVGQMADIDLAEDTFHRRFDDQVALTEAALTLPTMQASGLVRDMRAAANRPINHFLGHRIQKADGLLPTNESKVGG
jgi:hypothetical protein